MPGIGCQVAGPEPVRKAGGRVTAHRSSAAPSSAVPPAPVPRPHAGLRSLRSGPANPPPAPPAAPAPPPSGRRALLQDGAGRFRSGGSELTAPRKGRRGAGGRWVTLGGAVGGAAAVAVLCPLRAGERATDSPAPGNAAAGPAPGPSRPPEPLASGRSSALDAGVPPPAASFPDPPPRLRAGQGGSSSVSGAAAGTAKRAGPGAPPEDPLEEGGAAGRAGPPAPRSGHWSRPRCSVLRPALWLGSATCLHCFCCSWA